MFLSNRGTEYVNIIEVFTKSVPLFGSVILFPRTQRNVLSRLSLIMGGNDDLDTILLACGMHEGYCYFPDTVNLSQNYNFQ